MDIFYLFIYFLQAASPAVIIGTGRQQLVHTPKVSAVRICFGMPQLCAARGAQLTAPIPTAAPGQHRTFMGWEGGWGEGGNCNP